MARSPRSKLIPSTSTRRITRAPFSLPSFAATSGASKTMGGLFPVTRIVAKLSR
jgi:VIT1/CCC1 family predicted Fe2+/Mn2+ transporter